MGNLSGKRRKLTKIALELGCLAIALPGSFFGYRTFRWHGMIARADRIQDHLDL